MKLKNKKVLLGTIGTTLLVATPLATVVSCGSNTHAEAIRKVSVNIDKAIAYAKTNATDWNNDPSHHAKNAAGDHFIKPGEANGSAKSEYRDPMAWIAKSIFEQLFDSLGKSSKSFATLSKKLKKPLSTTSKTGFTVLGERLKTIIFTSKIITSNKVVEATMGPVTTGWNLPTDPNTNNPTGEKAKYSITNIADKMGTVINSYYKFWDSKNDAQKEQLGGEEKFSKDLVTGLLSSTVTNLIFPIKPKDVVSTLTSNIISALGDIFKETDITNGEFIGAVNELISQKNEISLVVGGQTQKLTIKKTSLPENAKTIIKGLDKTKNAGDIISALSGLVAPMIGDMFHNFALGDLISGKSIMHTAGDDKGHKPGNGHIYTYAAAINTVAGLKAELTKAKAAFAKSTKAFNDAKTASSTAKDAVAAAKTALAAATTDATLKAKLASAEKALKAAKDKLRLADDANYAAESLIYKTNIKLYALQEKDLLKQDKIDVDKAQKAHDASQKIKDLKAAKLALSKDQHNAQKQKVVDDLKADPEVVKLIKDLKDAKGKLYSDKNQLTNEKSAFGAFKLKRTLIKTVKTIQKAINGISVIGNNKILKKSLNFTEEDKNSLSAFGIDPKIGNMIFSLVEKITNLYK